MRAQVVQGPVLLVVVLIASCGGLTSSSALSARDGTSYPPCAPANVRICGVSCPQLDATQCQGGGCENVSSLAGTPASAGVCFSDDRDAGLSCAVCADGEACLQRDPDHLVCIPVEVCQRLWDLGVRDVCRYADKSAFDGRPLPSRTDCPSDATRTMCGGSCPPCFPVSGAAACIGRSPDHPFGLCPSVGSVADDADPQRYFVCSLVGTTYAEACPPTDPSFNAPYACAVFHTSEADVPAAKKYGLCIPPDNCRETAAAFPGGLDCYGPDGTE
jgi:hypothetical protein